MKRSKRKLLFITALIPWIALSSALVLGDSLVTTDGNFHIGTVTKTAKGYTLDTPKGPIDFPADKVKAVLYDHSPADSGPSSSGPSNTSPSVGAQPRKPVDPHALKALLEQGQAAMNAAEYADARDAFKDALDIDPNNAATGRGLGFAYMFLGKIERAMQPLEIAAAAGQDDRGLVLALSSSLVVNHNALRAVKYLVPYLKSHSKPVDETMLNALGISLYQIDGPFKKEQLIQDATKLYSTLNVDLEKTRPGKKHWGIDWIDGTVGTEKQTARELARGQLDAASVRLEAAEKQLRDAQLADKEASSSKSKRADLAQKKAQLKLNQATIEQASAKQALDAATLALAAAPGPAFPNAIEVQHADLMPPIAIAPTPASPAPSVQRLTRYSVAFAIATDVLVTSAITVEEATNITIETFDGKLLSATLLRAHHGDGLALLKVQGAKFQCLPLATAMRAGRLSCYSFPEVDLSNPAAKQIGVTPNPASESWTVQMNKSPRLPGGPLLQDGAVVGVELGDHDSELAAVPAASLNQLTSLVNDSANARTPATDPIHAVMQVRADR